MKAVSDRVLGLVTGMVIGYAALKVVGTLVRLVVQP